MIALSPRRLAAARRALPFAIVVLGVAAFDLGFHEPWRDEAGAMMEARAVPWSGLLEAMRCEGVPPLFHALLKLVAAVLPDPFALVAAGAFGLSVLLFGTYRLLLALSGAPRASALTALAFACTYAYAYELGVVVRQYGLGLGLALLSFAHLRDALRTGERRAARAGAVAAGLSALVSAHSACVAGAGLLAFGLVSIARRRPLRAWRPILFTLPCFALVAWLASPYPDRVAEGNVVQRFPPATTARLALQALVEGVMPADWWLAESLAPAPLREPLALLRSLAFWGVLGAVALGLAARLGAAGRRRRVGAFDVLAALLGAPPLLVVIVQHYWGFYRHHLFLGMPLLVVLAGWGLDLRVSGPLAGALRRSSLTLMAPWFLLQIALAAGSFVLDGRYPFSDTKAAARALAPGAHVVADAEWRSAAMLFWRPDIVMRSTSWRGRRFRYSRPDREWHAAAPLPPLFAEECREAPDRVWFAGIGTSLGPLSKCATRVAFPQNPLGEHPFTWESFDLYRMDCACVVGGR